MRFVHCTQFYSEADRISQYWEKRGGVTLAQVDAAADRGQVARVMIYDNEVLICN